MICHACRKEIDDKATKCPYCRSAVGSAATIQGIGALISLAIVGWIIYSVWWAPSSSAEPGPASVTALHVRAVDLGAAYRENEVRADQQFKDRQMQVLGTVERIGVDIAGLPYVILSGGEISVQASLLKTEANRASTLSAGQQVLVHCTCTGKLIFVQLHGCRF